jgi:hypothetical protein
LLLLDAAVVEIDPRQRATAPTDAVGVVRTQTLLQKLDFWVRYPDYLADELLTDYERSGERVLLSIASDILDSEEPELRSIPMLRYKFGAYEPLDMPMSVLSVAGLAIVTVVTHRAAGPPVRLLPDHAWPVDRPVVCGGLS